MSEYGLISPDYQWEDHSVSSFAEADFQRFLLWATNEVGANDIFLETNEPLGIKVNGVTHNVTAQVLEYEVMLSLLSKIYLNSAGAELRAGNYFNFPYSFTYGAQDQKMRFRVNVAAGNSIKAPDEGIEMVLRPATGEPPSVEELKICPELIDITKQRDGFIFVTGPTGSGKTTLLASLSKYIIQTQRRHFLTTEEPIEYDFKMIPNRLSRVIQSEVGINIESFHVSVENMLRRSPDVILMGELRDLKSIDGGILAAQTGHLLFATGHANNVAGALDRIADLYPADERRAKLIKLTSTIKALVHQLLLPKRGGGRIAVQERLFITTKIRMKMYEGIKQNDSLIEYLEVCVQEYGLPLKTDIKLKFSQGLLDIKDCLIQLAEGLDFTDIEFFKAKTNLFYQQKFISGEQYNTWMELLSVFNE